MMVTDTTPPVISNCPSDMSYQINQGEGSQLTISWQEPTATDDSGIPPSVLQTHAPGDVFSAGVTTVTYIFSDQAQNRATCEFDIEILRK